MLFHVTSDTLFIALRQSTNDVENVNLMSPLLVTHFTYFSYASECLVYDAIS